MRGDHARDGHVDRAQTPRDPPALASVAAGAGRFATTRGSFWPASPRWCPSSSRSRPSPTARRGSRPDFLSEVVLYALSAADLTMLVALVFVLARNIIKLVVERRRALPFARFRAKLVAVLLSMTIVPAVLVLIAGSEFIRTSIDNWFNAPMEDILASANKIAGDYYHERQLLVSDHASRLARALSAVDLAAADVRPIRDLVTPDVTLQRVKIVQVFRVGAGAAAGRVEPVVEVVATEMPTGYNRATADRLAARALAGQADTRSVEALGTLGRFAARGCRHHRQGRQDGPAWSSRPTT